MYCTEKHKYEGAHGNARRKRGERKKVADGERREGGVGDEVGWKGVPVTACGVGNEDVPILKGGVGVGDGGGEEGQV
jgi:hypothetical protein